MMIIENIIALAAFSLIGSITPGPNNLMLMASGTNFGLLRTAPHLLGICFGMIIMITLVWVGLGQLFDTYPFILDGLKIISSAYLLYLAWKIAQTKESKGAQASNTKPFSFLQAALFQWVNPKAWMMCLSIVTIYRLPLGPELSLILTVAISVMMTLPSMTCWAFMGMHIRRFLKDPLKLKVFNWICATSLVATLYPILF